MAKDVDEFKDPNTLFGRLRSACADEWERYCNHEFVRHIGDGTLPEQCFRHYLEQDYLFLIHFSRAYALAVFKAETLADICAAASTLNAILNYEMNLHVKYCSGWGLRNKKWTERTKPGRIWPIPAMSWSVDLSVMFWICTLPLHFTSSETH